MATEKITLADALSNVEVLDVRFVGFMCELLILKETRPLVP